MNGTHPVWAPIANTTTPACLWSRRRRIRIGLSSALLYVTSLVEPSPVDLSRCQVVVRDCTIASHGSGIISIGQRDPHLTVYPPVTPRTAVRLLRLPNQLVRHPRSHLSPLAYPPSASLPTRPSHDVISNFRGNRRRKLRTFVGRCHRANVGGSAVEYGTFSECRCFSAAVLAESRSVEVMDTRQDFFGRVQLWSNRSKQMDDGHETVG